MSLSKKVVRGIAGFTFTKIGADPENWIKRAIDFKDAAILIAKSDEHSIPHPYYYNAGIALELALKAIVIAKSKSYENNHRLNDLCTLVELNITKNQQCALELLSEFVIWSGRYPVPQKESQWNNYHDVVLEKHKVHKREEKRTFLDQARFPTVENFLTLWSLCDAEYRLSILKKA